MENQSPPLFTQAPTSTATSDPPVSQNQPNSFRGAEEDSVIRSNLDRTIEDVTTMLTEAFGDLEVAFDVITMEKLKRLFDSHVKKDDVDPNMHRMYMKHSDLGNGVTGMPGFSALCLDIGGSYTKAGLYSTKATGGSALRRFLELGGTSVHTAPSTVKLIIGDDDQILVDFTTNNQYEHFHQVENLKQLVLISEDGEYEFIHKHKKYKARIDCLYFGLVRFWLNTARNAAMELIGDGGNPDPEYAVMTVPTKTKPHKLKMCEEILLGAFNSVLGYTVDHDHVCLAKELSMINSAMDGHKGVCMVSDLGFTTNDTACLQYTKDSTNVLWMDDDSSGSNLILKEIRKYFERQCERNEDQRESLMEDRDGIIHELFGSVEVISRKDKNGEFVFKELIQSISSIFKNEIFVSIYESIIIAVVNGKTEEFTLTLAGRISMALAKENAVVWDLSTWFRAGYRAYIAKCYSHLKIPKGIEFETEKKKMEYFQNLGKNGNVDDFFKFKQLQAKVPEMNLVNSMLDCLQSTKRKSDENRPDCSYFEFGLSETAPQEASKYYAVLTSNFKETEEKIMKPCGYYIKLSPERIQLTNTGPYKYLDFEIISMEIRPTRKISRADITKNNVAELGACGVYRCGILTFVLDDFYMDEMYEFAIYLVAPKGTGPKCSFTNGCEKAVLKMSRTENSKKEKKKNNKKKKKIKKKENQKADLDEFLEGNSIYFTVLLGSMDTEKANVGDLVTLLSTQEEPITWTGKEPSRTTCALPNLATLCEVIKPEKSGKALVFNHPYFVYYTRNGIQEYSYTKKYAEDQREEILRTLERGEGKQDDVSLEYYRDKCKVIEYTQKVKSQVYKNSENPYLGTVMFPTNPTDVYSMIPDIDHEEGVEEGGFLRTIRSDEPSEESEESEESDESDDLYSSPEGYSSEELDQKKKRGRPKGTKNSNNKKKKTQTKKVSFEQSQKK